MATTGLNSAQIADRARAKGINLSNDQVQSILSQAWDQSQYGADPSKVDQLLSGGGGQMNSADQFLQSLKDQITQQTSGFDRSKEFDKNNPFSFDEAQAKASAEQRYNPYYEAQLADFTAGIDSQKQGVEGQKTLLTELNTINTKADNRNLQDAIQQSQQGYTDNGLFFSGANQRATGELGLQGNENAQKRDLSYNNSIDTYNRNLSDLTRNQATGVRQSNAQQTTDIQSEIEKQKAEAEARYAYEKSQYVGYPTYSQPNAGVQSLLQSFS